jgi:serine/threonine-protein kinase
MRIEAAAYRGKPVYFHLIGPWTRPWRAQPYKPTSLERAATVVGVVSALAMLMGGILLARRNLQLGRGDRKSASRLFNFVFAAWTVAWLSGAHHVASFHEFPLFAMFLSACLLFSASVWVLYIALEPYVRRRWPATLVSWSRLLAGSFRDPLVGRDVLFGCLLSATGIVLARLAWFIPSWLGSPPTQPYLGPAYELLGARAILSAVSNRLGIAAAFGLGSLFVLFLLRVILRKEWAAAAGFVLLFALTDLQGQSGPIAVGLVTGVIRTGLSVFVLTRFGLLAIVAAQVFDIFLGNFPLTTQMSAWYSGISLAGILLMAAMAFYSFQTSLGGRPMFRTVALDD